jgi:hypothetical protein
MEKSAEISKASVANSEGNNTTSETIKASIEFNYNDQLVDATHFMEYYWLDSSRCSVFVDGQKMYVGLNSFKTVPNILTNIDQSFKLNDSETALLPLGVNSIQDLAFRPQLSQIPIGKELGFKFVLDGHEMKDNPPSINYFLGYLLSLPDLTSSLTQLQIEDKPNDLNPEVFFHLWVLAKLGYTVAVNGVIYLDPGNDKFLNFIQTEGTNKLVFCM